MADYAFNEGETVIIKPRLAGGRYYNNLFFTYPMEEYCGREAVIIGRSKSRDGSDRYILDIDGGFWVWSEAMFERLNDDTGLLDDSGFEEFFSDFLSKNTATWIN